MTVLGSGGPELADGRASTGYVVTVDGKARVMVDTGPGTSVNFDCAGFDFTDLRVIALTHLHVDHSSDLPAFVKGSYFTDRSDDLIVLGPDGNDLMPGIDAFVQGQFSADNGVYRYLSDYLPGGNGDYALQVKQLTANADGLLDAYAEETLSLTAAPVHHGPIPALAWRIDIGECRLAFTGDMNGQRGLVPKLAQHAHLLVAHNAVPEGATGAARNLHMPPSVIGEIAAKAKVDKVLLSHFMRRTLDRHDQARARIREHYEGPLLFAEDGRDYAVVAPQEKP